MESLDLTLSLAVLMGVGFIAAKIGGLAGLPKVTGYILAGLVLGSSGLDLIPWEGVGDRLGHFTQIALMLIAFSGQR